MPHAFGTIAGRSLVTAVVALAGSAILSACTSDKAEHPDPNTSAAASATGESGHAEPTSSELHIPLPGEKDRGGETDEQTDVDAGTPVVLDGIEFVSGPLFTTEEDTYAPAHRCTALKVTNNSDSPYSPSSIGWSLTGPDGRDIPQSIVGAGGQRPLPTDELAPGESAEGAFCVKLSEAEGSGEYVVSFSQPMRPDMTASWKQPV